MSKRPIFVAIFDGNAISFGSAYNKARFLAYAKSNPKHKYRIEPMVRDSLKQRRYLEGAVVPEYAKFQYNINPRDKDMRDIARGLFMRDFNHLIVSDREGKPSLVAKSSIGEVNEITEKYCEWAVENGGKIPNTALFKEWRDKYYSIGRWETFHDFLEYLGLDCDAMPANSLDKIIASQVDPRN